MGNLKQRISALEKIAAPAKAPIFIVHFVDPALGTISALNTTTMQEIERLHDESEEHFLERVEIFTRIKQTSHSKPPPFNASQVTNGNLLDEKFPQGGSLKR